MKLLIWSPISLIVILLAICLDHGQSMTIKRQNQLLQNIVTWDSNSLLIHGQRIYVFSGEFHPYRLPSPDLWLDILQKIKAMGFSAVSFYIDWALLEGQEGVYRADGIFALEPFFEAASEAGIYLIARPGPYINAESAGGGFPGWLQRNKGRERTRDAEYMNATKLYIASVGAAIAKAQITNGGPVILVQPENEYSQANPIGDLPPYPFPDPEYFDEVEDLFREAGIVVPFIINDSSVNGVEAPDFNSSMPHLGDIWGHDSYPLGFDCTQPHVWPDGDLPTQWYARQESLAPETPDSLMEFQGGTFDQWGGTGYEQCAEMYNMEFERVFNKNNLAARVDIMNLYMIYGGTNWGNLAYPLAYSSYDYAGAIPENRVLSREKYSEIKLEANFLRVSPAFLSASVQNLSTGVYTSSSEIATTALLGTDSPTKFFVVRHSNYSLDTSATYTLTLPTIQGNISIPQLGGSLTLSGRDSKWHVTNYELGEISLLYSTAEIFTWKEFENKTVLVVYGGPSEEHELAIEGVANATIIQGSDVKIQAENSTILHWTTSSDRRVVQVGNLFVYILDRNSAYNYWVPDFENQGLWKNFTANVGNTTSVIVEAGYLIRNVRLDGSELHFTGDLNATAPLNVIGAPSTAKSLFFNDQALNFSIDSVTGDWSSTLEYTSPKVILPSLDSLTWKYLDDLPEIQETYDDSLWTVASNTYTNNTRRNISTPTSLFSSDYGYNSGILLYRGHFVSTSNETFLTLFTQGGAGYGSSAWLNSTFLGSWTGDPSTNGANTNTTYNFTSLVPNTPYVFTILILNNGIEEDPSVAEDFQKEPRGILDYTLSNRDQSAITWKLTGNFGGENYPDKARGPLNEGGLFAERQGFVHPNPPSGNWTSGPDIKPTVGIDHAGVAFYSTSFDLDLPFGYDIPLSFNIQPSIINGTETAFRAQLWVNGYQYGRINHFGPQTSFPVPQGILDYHGTNWLAVEIWAQDAAGARFSNFTLEAGLPVLTALKTPAMAPIPAFAPRPGVY